MGHLPVETTRIVYQMGLRDEKGLVNSEKDPGLERVPGHGQEREEVSQ